MEPYLLDFLPIFIRFIRLVRHLDRIAMVQGSNLSKCTDIQNKGVSSKLTRHQQAKVRVRR